MNAHTGIIGDARAAVYQTAGGHATTDLKEAEGVLRTLEPCIHVLVRIVGVFERARRVAALARVEEAFGEVRHTTETLVYAKWRHVRLQICIVFE